MRPTTRPVADAEIRRRLDALGKRRKNLRKKEEELAEDIREAVADARVAKTIPMEEAATRLDLNRTTLYQVYIPDDDPRPTARAA